jgi:hypothetical protein
MAVVEIQDTELASLRSAATHDDQVRALERDVTAAKSEWDSAKDRSLAAKKHYDQLVNELREFIAKGPEVQLSLFDTPMPKIVVENPRAWAEKSIDDLSFSKKIKEKLHEIGVHTVGQCVTLRAGKVAGYENGAADIAGWGAKKVAEFEDAVIANSPVDAAGMMGDDGSDCDVDIVEAEPEAETVPEDDTEGGIRIHDQPAMARVRLVGDLEGMEADGCVAGAEFDAIVEVAGAVIVLGGSEYILSDSEYVVVQQGAGVAV